MAEAIWYVYLAECSDGTLYTGITTDLKRRINQHNGILQGGARYTAARRPVVLAWSEEVDSRSYAQKREHEIRRLSRIEKTQLIVER